jgi:hypothetical protein
MDRNEFERLRDLPGKRIVGDIRIREVATVVPISEAGALRELLLAA